MNPVQFILPFKVRMGPIKGLLLATFKDDHEFETLESQLRESMTSRRKTWQEKLANKPGYPKVIALGHLS